MYYDGFGAERAVQQRIRRMGRALHATEAAQTYYDVHGRAFENTELLPFVDFMWTCEVVRLCSAR